MTPSALTVIESNCSRARQLLIFSPTCYSLAHRMSVQPATRLPFCAVSDAGRARPNNEDRYLADSRLGFFIVVDGVGGQAAGEIASECVAVSVHRFVEETFDDMSKSWPLSIDPALSTAGNRARVGTLVA